MLGVHVGGGGGCGCGKQWQWVSVVAVGLLVVKEMRMRIKNNILWSGKKYKIFNVGCIVKWVVKINKVSFWDTKY